MPGSELPDTKRPDPVPETSEPKFPDAQTPVPEVSRGECLTSNFVFFVNF